MVLDDFERRRRARETSNERIVCIVVVVAVTSLLFSQLGWNAFIARDPVPADRSLIVSSQVIVATAVSIVAHLAAIRIR